MISKFRFIIASFALACFSPVQAQEIIIRYNLFEQIGVGGAPNATHPVYVDSNLTTPIRLSGSHATATTMLLGNSGTGAAQLVLDGSNGDGAGSDYLILRQNDDLSADIVTAASSNASLRFGADTDATPDHLVIAPGGAITASGSFTAGGNISTNGTLSAKNGPLNISSNGADNTLRIGTTSQIDLAASASVEWVETFGAPLTTVPTIGTTPAYGFRARYNGADNKWRLSSGNGTTVTDILTIDRSGAPQLNLTGGKVEITNRVGPPSTPSGGAALYSEGGEMKVIDTTGNVTTLSNGVGGGASPTTDLAGGTSLTIDTRYFDSVTTNRTLTFSGSPANGSEINFSFDSAAITLTVPTCYPIYSTGSTTTLTFPAGENAIKWWYEDGKWRVAASTITEEMFSFPIVEPDLIRGVNDTIRLQKFPAELYPNGFVLTAVHIDCSATVTDTHLIEIWGNYTDGTPTLAESIAFIAAASAEDDGTFSEANIPADGWVAVDLDDATDNIESMSITIIGYAK